jgi:hypothetical protein
MSISNKEEFKLEILKGILIDKNNNYSIEILTNKYGFGLSVCLEILNEVYR